MLRRSSSLLLIALAGVVVFCGVVWWLATPSEPELPRPPALDDLQMPAALTDGGPPAPASDVLLAGPTEAYWARAGERTVVALPTAGGKPRTLARLDAPARAMALAGDTLWLTVREQIVKVPLS